MNSFTDWQKAKAAGLFPISKYMFKFEEFQKFAEIIGEEKCRSIAETVCVDPPENASDTEIYQAMIKAYGGLRAALMKLTDQNKVAA